MNAVALPPELAQLVERLVDERVEAALDARLGPLQAALDSLTQRVQAGEAAADSASILVFHGDLDHLLAAFIIATSAAAMGLKVSMYF
ncbi:MAG TPA: DsrE/DsrF/DrsH-like family protein, partial [Nannocystis sp.]